jgi:hypothetical protein
MEAFFAWHGKFKEAILERESYDGNGSNLLGKRIANTEWEKIALNNINKKERTRK